VSAAFIYQLLADAVLALHLAIVVFVVAGMVLIVAGNRAGWGWVNALWFRSLHLLTIGVVAAQAWLGVVCPLTTFEMWLRSRANASTYRGNFIEHWLQALLYWEAPAWVFAIAYSAFGLAVTLAWWRYPPAWRKTLSKPSTGTAGKRSAMHNRPSSSGGKP
jgi:hypothetical protein